MKLIKYIIGIFVSFIAIFFVTSIASENVYADISGLVIGSFDHFFEKMIKEKDNNQINNNRMYTNEEIIPISGYGRRAFYLRLNELKKDGKLERFMLLVFCKTNLI